MEELKIAQFNNNFNISKEKASKILKQISVSYCLPETHPKYSGYTSLHFAVKKRALDLTNELLRQGADLFKQGTKDECTPLHIVMDTAFDRKYKCSLFEKLQEYCLMNILISKQIEINNFSNPKNEYGLSHLHIACIINHPVAVEFFAKAREPLNQSINYDSDDYESYKFTIQKSQLQGCTPLHCAVKYSSVEAADILLQHGADVHIKNGKGMSSVHLLIEHIMDLTDFIRIGKRTLCMPYIEEIERTESIIKLVLKTRASSDVFVDDMGLSALHLACTLRDRSTVEEFLKRKVDVNMSVKKKSTFWAGWTPVHFAACFHIDTMILLMQYGADIRMTNSQGESALDLCAKRFTPADMQLVLSTKREFKNIVLSDNSTKLSELLLTMNDFNKFSDFMQELQNVNLIVPITSPIWAGCNLLHLLVSLNEKTIAWKDLRMKYDLPKVIKTDIGRYNCTEEEEALYCKRIELCLKYGCSVSMKNANGQTPIHLAFSMLRETAIIEKLLSCSEDNDVDEDNLSHLHIACAVGQLDAVKRYLSRGANVNSRAKSSFDWCKTKTPVNMRKNSTPLHVAVAFGHMKLVEYLVENNSDIYAKDSLGLTPIHLVMSRRKDARNLATALLKTPTNLRDSVSRAGLSHLHVAAYVRNHEAIEQLLLKGARVDCIVGANIKQPPFLVSWAGKTPLHVAREYSDSCSEVLLKHGANMHAKDLQKMSVLQYAVEELDEMWTVSLVLMLQTGKCNIEKSGITLLHFACGTYDLDWAKKLLKEGADVNARISAKGMLTGATPLYIIHHPSIIEDIDADTLNDLYKLLLDYGADVTIKCCDGSTPLHMMYERNYILCNVFSLDQNEEEFIEVKEYVLQLADLLLEKQKSYNVNPVNRNGFSHFHFACVRNKLETVKKFLDHGANVNQSVDPFTADIGGFTPLHFAMAHGSKEVAYLLLERGADVNAEDANGNKPLQAAVKRNFIDIPLFETMLRRGADIHAENLKEETLLYCLLKSTALTLEGLEFFLVGGCFIKQLNTSDKESQGIIGLAMRSASPIEWPRILNRLTQVEEVKKAIWSGFNVIESVVAVKQNGEITVDNYLRSIEFLMTIGCELDQQNTEGKTALHKAVSFYNLEAIDALLQLGANLNVADNMNECALTEKIIDVTNASNESRQMDVVKVITRHIWKMKFISLNVKDSNLRCLEKVEKQMSFDSALEQSCQNEMTKAQETKIDQSLTVKDFLSEFGAVVRYPRMCPDRQAIVHQFFNCTVFLSRKFPELYGILALQYRKACARTKLSLAAK